LPGSVKIGGAFKTIATPSVKIGGAWKTVNAGFTRIGGAWKQWFSSAQPAYEHIATTTLGASASVVEFAGLDTYSADYKHLQIRFSAKNTGSPTDVRITFNDVTTTSYARHMLRGEGTSLSSSNATSQAHITLDNAMKNSQSTGSFGAAIVDIIDAFSTSKNTTIKSLHGQSDDNGSAIALVSGLFNNTALINKISLRPSSSSFAIGSRFSVYGIRG
jgi:hypothetical protein